jgi:hypothetical protein
MYLTFYINLITQVVPIKGIFRPNTSIKAKLVTGDDGGGGGGGGGDENLAVGMSYLTTNVFRRTFHYASVWFRMCWLLRNCSDETALQRA